MRVCIAIWAQHHPFLPALFSLGSMVPDEAADVALTEMPAHEEALPSDDDRGDSASEEAKASATSRGSSKTKGSGSTRTSTENSKHLKKEYRTKEMEKRKKLVAAGGKIECRGCRVKRKVEFFFVNDVYDKVCKRSLGRIKIRCETQGEELSAGSERAPRQTQNARSKRGFKHSFPGRPVAKSKLNAHLNVAKVKQRWPSSTN